jgi:hypothetical protein
LSNFEAFEQLETAIDRIGRPYTREQIVKAPTRPNEVVARGIERIMPVGVIARQYIEGDLSARALRALPEVDDPYQRGEPLQATKWLVRTRLRFFVPRNALRGLEAGSNPHVAIACYILTADAPLQLDEYFATEANHDNDTPAGVISNYYNHGTPSNPNMKILSDKNNDPRKVLLRKWFKDSPEADGMAMLSPNNDGQVTAQELPRTIQWLLKSID